MKNPHIHYESARFKVIELKPGWGKIIPSNGRGAAVIPIMPNGDILLVQEARDTVEGSFPQWNIPRGASDPGESSLETAIRELEEETALAVGSDRMVSLITLCPDNGMFLDGVPLFAAVLHGTAPQPLADGKEILAVRAFSQQEIGEMALRGEMRDAFTLSAITLWNAFCRQQGVTSAGVHNFALSVTVRRNPELFYAISKVPGLLRSAGWMVHQSAEQIQVSASWLPGKKPSINDFDIAAHECVREILNIGY